jgi:hypothetical protein
VASSMPITALGCPVVTRTTSHWNSSLRPFRRSGHRSGRASRNGAGTPRSSPKRDTTSRRPPGAGWMA